jgi:hypothetical protein
VIGFNSGKYDMNLIKPCVIFLQSFYQEVGVDMFKDTISVPGVTLKYQFKTISSKFLLPYVLRRKNH